MPSSITNRPLITLPHDEMVHNGADSLYDKSDLNRLSMPESHNSGPSEPDLEEPILTKITLALMFVLFRASSNKLTRGNVNQQF